MNVISNLVCWSAAFMILVENLGEFSRSKGWAFVA
jgi:hypothetical protein